MRNDTTLVGNNRVPTEYVYYKRVVGFIHPCVGRNRKESLMVCKERRRFCTGPQLSRSRVLLRNTRKRTGEKTEGVREPQPSPS